MTTAHAATLAHLNTLRAQQTAALRNLNMISETGTTAEWMAANRAAKPVCMAVTAEIDRITREGFDGDLDFEIAVLGRLSRRHERSSMTTHCPSGPAGARS